MTITTEAEVEVDIDDVWEEMGRVEQREFLNEKNKIRAIEKWQDFAYQLSDEDTEDLIRWLKFYDKL